MKKPAEAGWVYTQVRHNIYYLMLSIIPLHFAVIHAGIATNIFSIAIVHVIGKHITCTKNGYLFNPFFILMIFYCLRFK